MNGRGRRAEARPYLPSVQATRQDAKRLSERPGERFERSIVCVEADVRHRHLCAGQLPCGSFQQQPSAQGHRRLLDDCPEQSIELRPASITLAGKTPGILLLVERFQHCSAQPLGFIHRKKIPFQSSPRLIASPKLGAGHGVTVSPKGCETAVQPASNPWLTPLLRTLQPGRWTAASPARFRRSPRSPARTRRAGVVCPTGTRSSRPAASGPAGPSC